MIMKQAEITAASTLSIRCESSVGDKMIIRPSVHPDRKFSAEVLRRVSFMMEEAAIETFGGFYHGLIHPYDLYDLLSTAPPPGKSSDDFDCLEYAGFRLRKTTAVRSVLLFGKSSNLLNLVEMYVVPA